MELVTREQHWRCECGREILVRVSQASVDDGELRLTIVAEHQGYDSGIAAMLLPLMCRQSMAIAHRSAGELGMIATTTTEET